MHISEAVHWKKIKEVFPDYAEHIERTFDKITVAVAAVTDHGAWSLDEQPGKLAGSRWSPFAFSFRPLTDWGAISLKSH